MFNFFVAGIKCFRLDLIHFRLELIFLWLELFPNFRFKVGHFFRRDGAADPRCLRGVPLGGQRPPEPENFCIFDFRGGPLRPPEGQNWPTLDPKKFPQLGWN